MGRGQGGEESFAEGGVKVAQPGADGFGGGRGSGGGGGVGGGGGG